jgi:hypothetical protein
MCHGYGLIEKRNKTTQQTFAFRCECHLGQSDKLRGLPIYKRIFDQDYEDLFNEKDIAENSKSFRGRFGAKKLDDELAESNVQVNEEERDFSVF